VLHESLRSIYRNGEASTIANDSDETDLKTIKPNYYLIHRLGAAGARTTVEHPSAV